MLRSDAPGFLTYILKMVIVIIDYMESSDKFYSFCKIIFILYYEFPLVILDHINCQSGLRTSTCIYLYHFLILHVSSECPGLEQITKHYNESFYTFLLTLQIILPGWLKFFSSQQRA